MSEAIRSVQRALCLIRLMNTRSAWTLADLVRELQLPKTTVFRLLHTLEEEGFVRSPPGTHGLYRISSSVQDLASGITSESLLADIAAPLVIAGKVAEPLPRAQSGGILPIDKALKTRRALA